MNIDKDIWKEDLKLAENILNGGLKSWETLYNKYYGLVRGYVRKIMFRCYSAYLSADDIASEAFVISYEQLAYFRGESKYSTWVCRIAKTLLAKEYEKFLTDDELKEYAISTTSVYKSPESIVIEKERNLCVRQAFGSLPPLWRFLLVQYVFEKPEETIIARQTGLNILFVRDKFKIAKSVLKHRFLVMYSGQAYISCDNL